jgi:glycerol uptake facilitator-like aquaporin
MLPIILAEALGSFFFVSVILATAGVEVMAPLVIGLALAISIYFTSKASMGSMNPIVTVALALTGKLDIPTSAVYIIAELIGAVLAVMWWKFVHGTKKK